MYVLWNTHMCIQIWINILCMHGLNICHISSCIGRLSQIEDYWYTSIWFYMYFMFVCRCVVVWQWTRMNAFHHMIHLALQNTESFERNRRKLFFWVVFFEGWLRIFAIQRHLGDLSSRTRLSDDTALQPERGHLQMRKNYLCSNVSKNWNEKMSTNEF